MRIPGSIAALILLLAGCASTAPGVVDHGDISIDHQVMSAASEPGTPVAAYAGFDNAGPADRLLGIDCDCAAKVELHHVTGEGEQMRMDSSFPLALPPGRTEVKPPGIPLHFMLMDTTRPFVAGERVPMQLRFERAGTVQVEFLVVEKSADGWAAWAD